MRSKWSVTWYDGARALCGGVEAEAPHKDTPTPTPPKFFLKKYEPDNRIKNAVFKQFFRTGTLKFVSRAV